MFFIGGMSSKQDKLDFNQTIVCSNCGKYGRYEVFMEYTSLNVFFIPLTKFSKKYYAKSSCCSSIYSIDKEVGDRIARGENVTLKESDLQLIRSGHSCTAKECSSCGFETYDDFKYCPKCGNEFK